MLMLVAAPVFSVGNLLRALEMMTHGEVEVGGFSELESHIRISHVLVTEAAGVDGVGTAGAHAVDVESAL